jgi:sensor c-di-GMP phosphodiesterase-like protein
MAYVDCIDSHYQAVKVRMATINANRAVKGLLMAQDWPPKNVELEAFYLLTLKDSAVGRNFYSASTPVKIENVQWVWIIKGTDTQQGVRAANRGDRFRTMFAMKDELTKALYPNFTEKKSWSLDAGGVWQAVSENPVEFITWTPVEFYEKSAMESGVMWGSASVRIVNMTDTITS